MSVNAKDVMKLRKATGAGMMDCKKALSEAEGDYDKAVEIIRKRGKAIANKRADREATEGVCITKTSADKSFGAMLVLNCETDFVAKNESFVALATKILDAAIENKVADLEALKALAIDNTTVGEFVAEQTGIVGEKLDLSFYQSIEATYVATYIHAGNKLSTMISFDGAVEEQVGRDVAMQAAAMSPIAINKEAVAAETVENELRIAMEKFRQEGKPENMLEKIAQGALNKWFKENTLIEQTFVKDGKMTVSQYLAQEAKGVNVTGMVRNSLNG
ncbi:translation elongation factor Ts [Halosquirtibacter laminarini]|uniref:Translation elongation factor Ts n=1 Tax=Halosquirtibacter laminarini TaxID=3374600 RepID=A0AC61NEA5_9BACT|nr:translation elongation factor Ts [Prolixibacteraceae bacterium]